MFSLRCFRKKKPAERKVERDPTTVYSMTYVAQWHCLGWGETGRPVATSELARKVIEGHAAAYPGHKYRIVERLERVVECMDL